VRTNGPRRPRRRGRDLRVPGQPRHGVALRVGYELCLAGGAEYVVTLDADGQNDPAEIPVMLQPLLDDEADFVIASRRLGVDHTEDQLRRAGVFVLQASSTCSPARI